MTSVAALKTLIDRSIHDIKTFDWHDLSDPESMGVWPNPVKLMLAVALFVVCLGGGYWLHIKSLQVELARVAAEEAGLRADLELKAVLAANLETYRQQMLAMEERFGTLLSHLPGQTEVPGLLEDITFTGLGSGLRFSSIQLQSEVEREFYAELPISMTVTGSYHDFGAFVSGVANLSRIVTLHDFTINADTDRNELAMEITARTYRYSADDDRR